MNLTALWPKGNPGTWGPEEKGLNEVREQQQNVNQNTSHSVSLSLMGLQWFLPSFSQSQNWSRMGESKDRGENKHQK